MNTMRTRFRSFAPLTIPILLYFGAIVLVNPLREMCIDDDWIYALTVKHLLQTGHYRPHDWASANMPFQIAWGSIFCAVGGFSFSALRLSSLVLGFFGLLATYGLAREHDLTPTQAGLVTLCMLVNPLFIRLGFTFMTDIPFLSCLTLALLGYTRAIRRQSYRTMLLASVVASFAILTRQFGVSLLGGLAVSWLAGRGRRQQVALYVAGSVLPAMAAAAQLLYTALRPNWMMTHYVGPLQRDYLLDAAVVVKSLWRLAVIAPYIAVFSAPLVMLVLILRGRGLLKAQLAHTSGAREWRERLLLLIVATCVIAGLSGGYCGRQSGLLMPYLSWNLGILESLGRTILPGPAGLAVRGVITAVSVAGGIWAYRVFLMRYLDRSGWGTVPESQRFLDYTAAFSLIFALAFLKMGDEYLLVFCPYLLVVAGRQLRDDLARFKVVVVAAATLLLVACCLWTRATLAAAEAGWTAGESIRNTGVEPDRVFVGWVWNCYHGAWEAYQREVGERQYGKDFNFSNDFFVRWLEERRRAADFWVTSAHLPRPAGEHWTTIREVQYSAPLKGPQHLLVLKRTR